MRRYVLLVALLPVVVPLAVVVSEEAPNDGPAFCLLINGVSWLPVDSLPPALRECITDETPTQVMNGITLVPIKQFVEAQGGTVGWDGSAGLVMVEFEDQVLRLKALYSESFWQAQKGGPGTSPPIAIGQIPSRPCYKDDCGIYWVTPELLPKPLQEEVTDNTPGVTYQGVFAVSLKHFAQDHGAKFHEEERSVSVTFEGHTTAYMPLGLNAFLWRVGKRPEYQPPPRKPGRRGYVGLGSSPGPASGDSIRELVYDVDRVALTPGTGKFMFLGYVRDVVPQTLAQFPHATGVRVVGTATFETKRGWQSQGIAFIIFFSRRNAATINWKNVSIHDVDDIADSFYQHPGVKAG